MISHHCRLNYRLPIDCLEYRVRQIVVVSGDLSTFQKNSTTVTERQVRHVERIVIHPEYKEEEFKNDVAILLVSHVHLIAIQWTIYHRYTVLSYHQIALTAIFSVIH